MNPRFSHQIIGLFVTAVVSLSCQTSLPFVDEAEYGHSLTKLMDEGRELLNRSAVVYTNSFEIDPRYEQLRVKLNQARLSLSAELNAISRNASLTNYGLTMFSASLKRLLSLTDTVHAATNAQKNKGPLVVVSPEAYTNDHLGPNDVPVGLLAEELYFEQSPGEYNSRELALYGLHDVDDLSLEFEGFEGPDKLDSSIIDAKFLSSWFQAGKEVYEPLPFLSTRRVNELLVKDDELIKVDDTSRQNYLKVIGEQGKTRYVLISGPSTQIKNGDRVLDSKNLSTFSIKNSQNKLIWMTIHLPQGVAAGEYLSRLKVLSKGMVIYSSPIKLTVDPFSLTKSPLEYSLYYRGVLANSATITSDQKNEVQYVAELKDMMAHGITNPTVYQDDDDGFQRVLELRKELGMNVGAFYGVGNGVGEMKTQQDLEGLAARIKKWKTKVLEYGFNELYLYGIEELLGEKLKRQREAWEFTHKHGAKVFTATFPGSFGAIGDLLDLSVQAFKPNPDDARRYHSHGNKIYAYSYPQVGNEEALTYRRNFGIELYLSGYDGAMNYAYQHGFGHVWNDFDAWPWRDHNFTYPTSEGPILTKQWEGFREAVYDVRYIATLKAFIDSAKPERLRWREAASRYLESLDLEIDLDEMRDRIKFYIMKLTE